MYKYNPQIGMAYQNTQLEDKSFRLVRNLSGNINTVCLVDMQTWECLTAFIPVDNRRDITKREWNSICNGCPEYFYKNEEGDIVFDTPIQKLTFEKAVALIEAMAEKMNEMGEESLAPKRVERLLNTANIQQEAGIVDYLLKA